MGISLNNEIFIEKTANNTPYFFTDFIKTHDKQNTADTEFVQSYLSELLLNKNYFLFREIRNSQDMTKNDTYKIKKDKKIIYALLSDIKVAKLNKVWVPFGDICLSELRDTDGELRNNLLLEYKGPDKDKLWSYTVYNCIRFFDIMVREALRQNSGYHMWLFYYRHFVDSLIKLLPENSLAQFNNKNHYPTLIHYIIQDIVGRHKQWLHVGHKLKSDFLVSNICDSLGWCLNSIAMTPKLSMDQKVYCFEKIFRTYFWFSNTENSDVKMKAIEKMFVNPIMGFKNEKYYTDVFRQTWDEFDKYYEGINENGSLPQFEEEVLEKLGINE